MAKIGSNYRTYLESRLNQGYDAQEAAGMPGAMEAAAKDKSELAKDQGTRTTDEFLGLRKGTGFANTERGRQHLPNVTHKGRLYDVSPEYRAAVVEIAKLSSDEVMGLVGLMRTCPQQPAYQAGAH
jgi:hypothetical protein